jgi:hypothetical protein
MEGVMPRRSAHAGGARAAALALLALSLAGCADATGPRDETPTQTVAEGIATFLADSDPTSLYASATGTRTGTNQFERTTSCPAGGGQTMSGKGTSSLDEATRVVSSTWTNTHTQDDCAFQRTRGDQTLTVVIDGSVTATGAFSYRLPEQRGDPRVLLSYTITRKGATTTKVGDRTQRCEINTRETYDPATDRFTITGTICGREVNVTRDQGTRKRD